jgi:hypothetical protein
MVLERLVIRETWCGLGALRRPVDSASRKDIRATIDVRNEDGHADVHLGHVISPDEVSNVRTPLLVSVC